MIVFCSQEKTANDATIVSIRTKREIRKVRVCEYILSDLRDILL